mgnify:CR=1 FL=1
MSVTAADLDGDGDADADRKPNRISDRDPWQDCGADRHAVPVGHAQRIAGGNADGHSVAHPHEVFNGAASDFDNVRQRHANKPPDRYSRSSGCAIGVLDSCGCVARIDISRATNGRGGDGGADSGGHNGCSGDSS